MALFLTPGRVQSKADNNTHGGYKIYLTDNRGGWVVLGGQGRRGNPLDLPIQKPQGYPTEEEAWEFIAMLQREHPDVLEQPLESHTLYYYAPRTCFLDHGSRRPISDG